MPLEDIADPVAIPWYEMAPAARADRRCKVLRLGTGCLSLFLGEGDKSYSVVRDGIPADAVIVDCQFRGIAESVLVLVASASFEPVPEGQPWPEITPMMMAPPRDVIR